MDPLEYNFLSCRLGVDKMKDSLESIIDKRLTKTVTF